jgi:hypothetical protein
MKNRIEPGKQGVAFKVEDLTPWWIILFPSNLDGALKKLNNDQNGAWDHPRDFSKSRIAQIDPLLHMVYVWGGVGKDWGVVGGCTCRVMLRYQIYYDFVWLLTCRV